MGEEQPQQWTYHVSFSYLNERNIRIASKVMRLHYSLHSTENIFRLYAYLEKIEGKEVTVISWIPLLDDYTIPIQDLIHTVTVEEKKRLERMNKTR